MYDFLIFYSLTFQLSIHVVAVVVPVPRSFAVGKVVCIDSIKVNVICIAAFIIAAIIAINDTGHVMCYCVKCPPHRRSHRCRHRQWHSH